MKRVEVSAICDGYAITPDAKGMFLHIPFSRGAYWVPVVSNNPLTYWSAWTMNKKVWRGIFTIKVEGDQ